jgi:hypothetical protein
MKYDLIIHLLAASLIIYGIAVFIFPKPCGSLSHVAGGIDTICECIGMQYSDVKANGTDVYCMGLCLLDHCINQTSRGIEKERYSISLLSVKCSNSTNENFKIQIINNGNEIMDVNFVLNAYAKNLFIGNNTITIHQIPSNSPILLNFTIPLPQEYNTFGKILSLEIGVIDHKYEVLFQNITCITSQ